MNSILVSLILSIALPITASALALKNLPAGSKIIFTNNSQWILPAAESTFYPGLATIHMHKKLQNNTDFRGYTLITSESAILDTVEECNTFNGECISYYSKPASITLSFGNKHFAKFTFGRGSSQEFNDITKMTIEDLNEYYKDLFTIVPNSTVVKP